jgi:putative ABC transport system ATP-binding protein
MGLLEKLHENGNTIILVTHEEDIAKHAHRIIRLIDGKIDSDYLNKDIIRVKDY